MRDLRLEAEHEDHENDADLGEKLEGVRSVQDPQNGRAEYQAGEYFAEHGALLDAIEQLCADLGGEQN